MVLFAKSNSGPHPSKERSRELKRGCERAFLQKARQTPFASAENIPHLVYEPELPGRLDQL